MWIMTNNAFVSIVVKEAGRNRDDDLMAVRARAPQHLQNFIGKSVKVLQDAGTDYRYRTHIRRRDLHKHVSRALRNVDYGNFKNSVKDDGYHSALNRVWGAMFDFQEKLRWGRGGTRKGKKNARQRRLWDDVQDAGVNAGLIDPNPDQHYDGAPMRIEDYGLTDFDPLDDYDDDMFLTRGR